MSSRARLVCVVRIHRCAHTWLQMCERACVSVFVRESITVCEYRHVLCVDIHPKKYMAAAFVALTPGTEFYIRNIWPALSPRIRILHNKHIHTYVGLPHWLCVDIDPYRTLHNYTHPYICWCATLAVLGDSSENKCLPALLPP